jgi:hypothetical protein
MIMAINIHQKEVVCCKKYPVKTPFLIKNIGLLLGNGLAF